MKQIQPIEIWNSGTKNTAEYIQVTCVNDNYETSATNYWQLFTKQVDAEGVESAGQQLAVGNLTISGQNYIDWGNQPAMAINTWIYNWTANQINVVIK